MSIKEIIDSEVRNIIDKQIKEMWTRDIYEDYVSCRILKEDSLKNSFYHHLRTRLGDVFLDEHNLQIYTEFNEGDLKGTGKRADLVIVEIDDDYEEGYLGDYIRNIIAIVELKFKANRTAAEDIQKDVDKVKSYIQDDGIECQYYLAAIREVGWEKDHYIEIADEDKLHWAKGRVTELVASYDPNDEIQFDVYSYNGLND